MKLCYFFISLGYLKSRCLFPAITPLIFSPFALGSSKKFPSIHQISMD